MSVKTGAKRHTHKYHKIEGLWHCALRNCTHYMPKNVENNVEGKESICWECGKIMLLDNYNMQNDKPICPNCDPESPINKLTGFLTNHGL